MKQDSPTWEQIKKYIEESLQPEYRIGNALIITREDVMADVAEAFTNTEYAAMEVETRLDRGLLKVEEFLGSTVQYSDKDKRGALARIHTDIMRGVQKYREHAEGVEGGGGERKWN